MLLPGFRCRPHPELAGPHDLLRRGVGSQPVVEVGALAVPEGPVVTDAQAHAVIDDVPPMPPLNLFGASLVPPRCLNGALIVPKRRLNSA